MQVLEYETQKRNESEWMRSCKKGASSTGLAAGRVELEHLCWDPKDNELSMNRTKPEEILVEVRSGFDVQINRLICV